MAEAKLQHYISSLSGTLKKGGVIFRQKHHQIDDRGHTIAGKQEVYEVTNPRNFRTHPKTAGELKNQTAFAQTVQRVKEEMADPKRLAVWKQRFQEQIARPAPGNKKSYRVLRAFIQATILKESKE